MPTDPDSANTRYCLTCRYPLRGLTHPRCPECGRGFDPGDTKTTADTSTRQIHCPAWMRSHYFSAQLFTLGFVLAYYQFGDLDTRRFHERAVIQILLIIGSVLAIHIALRRPTLTWRRAASSIGIIAGFFCLTLGIEYNLVENPVSLLLALVAIAGLFAGSIIHGLKCPVSATGRFVAMLPVYVVWCIALLIFTVIVASKDTNPFDYWTYWFWTPVRW